MTLRQLRTVRKRLSSKLDFRLIETGLCKLGVRIEFNLSKRFSTAMDKDIERISDISTLSSSSDHIHGEKIYGNDIIQQNVTNEEFDRWKSTQDETRRKYWLFIDNSILLTEQYLTAAHERASFFFAVKAVVYNLQLSGHDSMPLEAQGSYDRRLRYSCKQPDQSFAVVDRHCPNLLVEVAVSQTLESLHVVCSNYFLQSDNIMIAIGIKLFGPQVIDGIIYRPMLLFLYLRQVIPNHEPYTIRDAISFGNSALSSEEVNDIMRFIPNAPQLVGVGHGYPDCARRQLPCYQLQIPYAHLLCIDNNANTADIQSSYQHDWIIDLYDLQETILRGTAVDLALIVDEINTGKPKPSP